jgi:hypothetical protein
MIVTGYIHRFDTVDGWKRYAGGSRKRVIDIEGEVVNAQGDRLAVFRYRDKKRYQEMTEMDFLLTAGTGIGRSLCRWTEEGGEN